MPGPTVLSGDPVMQSVSVELRPPASATVFLCKATFRGYDGSTPVWSEVEVGFDDEAMAADFFSTTVKDALVDALEASGYTVSETFALPPIATDLTVWDPETNAPYP